MKKKIVWIVVAIVIILVALAGILYFTTDLFKTKEQLFYKYFASSMEVAGKTDYAEAIQELKKQSEEPIEVAGEITVKMSSADIQSNEALSVLEKGKITYNTKTINKEQKAQCSFTLNYDNKDVVTLDILKNKEQYGIKVQEAYDKYISLENNNLKALFQKLGLDTTDIPDKIETIDMYELLDVDKETLNHIKDTYSKVIKENIPEECYFIQKDVTINIDGTDITTNSYKLELTEKQLEDVITKVVETLKTDDTTLDLIVNKYNMLVEPYKGFAQVETITKEQLISNLDEMLTELAESSANEEKALELITYATKDNKARIEEIVDDMKLTIDIIKTDNENKMIMSFESEDGNCDVTMLYGENKAEITMKVSADQNVVELNVKEEVREAENIIVEDFTDQNSVKLNDMTQNEINSLIQTVYNNIIYALPQKMELLGIEL